MPIYEYACEKCGELTEVLAKVSDPPPSKCPQCGSKKMQRVVSRTSFQLKGGGWYSDLYSSTGKKAATDSAKPAATDAAKPAKIGCWANDSSRRSCGQGNRLAKL